jgi:hypothetical protein
MAGKLAQEIGLGGDWSGVVELLKEELKDSGQTRSMEEHIILTSLNAIHSSGHPHATNIVRLLHAFSIIPEDCRVQLEVVAMLYRAEGGDNAQPPSLLSIRRWLKFLLDRNLILGSVDRPSLHDIVMDFVRSEKSEEELRAANRRLVELLRSERPPGGWDLEGAESGSQISRYMMVAAAHHIRAASGPGWSNDEAWLSDFPQDAIPVHAAEALGAERVGQLAHAAESAGNWWLAAVRWSALAMAEHRTGGSGASMPLCEACIAALDHVQLVRDTCTQDEKDQLEMKVLLKPLQTYSMRAHELGYGPRLSEVLERMCKGNPEVVDITSQLCTLQFAAHVPYFGVGDIDGIGATELKILKVAKAALATVHKTDRTLRCQLFLYFNMVAMWSIPQGYTPDWNWDELYGERGELLVELAEIYDYSSMHSKMRSTPWLGFDAAVGPPGCHSLATRWGDFSAFNLAVDRLLPSIYRSIDEIDPNDAITIAVSKGCWVWWLYAFGRTKDAGELLHRGTFAGLEPAFDWFASVMPENSMRPRGHAPTPGDWATVDGFLAHARFLEVLIADEAAAPSVVAALPSLHQWSASTNGTMVLMGDIISPVPAMLAHERGGNAAGALGFTSLVLEARRGPNGFAWGAGSEHASKVQQYFAHACRGRVLAAQGKREAAEAALDSAAAAAEVHGAHLLVALAVRDLCEHVLDPSGRVEEGRRRLEESVSRLQCSVEDLAGYVLPRGPVRPLSFAGCVEAKAPLQPASAAGAGEELAALTAELQSMRPSARRKRAVAAGVTKDELEEAEDADDSAATIIAFIIAREPSKSSDGSEELAALTAELQSMRPSARRKRAVAAGVTEDEQEEAEDADDSTAAIIALIIAREGLASST